MRIPGRLGKGQGKTIDIGGMWPSCEWADQFSRHGEDLLGLVCSTPWWQTLGRSGQLGVCQSGAADNEKVSPT